MAHHLQHWAGISPALAYQYIGLNKINVHPMLAYCWPIVYDHGSAVKQHWLKVSFLQGTPATQYPDTMLVQIWKSVIDNGTTFNQHWVSASQKKAVTSAERKYILDLQVNKYGLFGSAMAGRDRTPVKKQLMPSIPGRRYRLLTLQRQNR